MATLQLNGKTLATQVSSAEPVLGSNLTFPSGHIIQTQYSQVKTFGTMTGLNSVAGNYLVIKSSGAASTDLSTSGMIQVPITPKSNSKIKIEVQWMGELNGDTSWDIVFTLVRSVAGSAHTAIKNDTSANSSTTNGRRGIGIPFRTYHESHVGSTPEGASFTYFDSTHGANGTEEVIYKLAVFCNATGLTELHTNRVQQSTYYTDEMGISTISATEIAG